MATSKQVEYQKQKTKEYFEKIDNLIRSGDLPKVMRECFYEERHMSRYSPSNQLIIALEMSPNRVVDAMGYKQWEKLGRRVREGELSIRILAPREVKIPKYIIT